jgi:hypothetical protein
MSGDMNAGRPIQSILGQLEHTKETSNGWTARCPSHADHHNSLSISQGDDGRVLLNCFAGCEAEAIVKALGLNMKDLFPREGGGGVCTSRKPAQPSNRSSRGPENKGKSVARANATGVNGDNPGLTVAAYAEAKRLPLGFLQGIGLTDMTYHGVPAVRIPYFGHDGDTLAARFRIGMTGDRFRWKNGDKPCLFGLSRLEEARQAGYIILVEGESDCHTLKHHGFPAIGVPGAANWREGRDAKELDGIATIYVVIEPDQGGEAVKNWLGGSAISDRVKLIDLGAYKDPSDLHMDNPDTFKSRFRSAMDEAVAWAEHTDNRNEADRSEAWELCQRLAEEPRILDRFADELKASGVAGERRVGMLLYLVVTSRLLPKPVSAAVKGPSSAGKSFLAANVLKFFPEEAYQAVTAMSERALAYGTDPLKHRMLVVYEAAGLSGDFASYLIRSLLSEGRLSYETVEKTEEGFVSRLIEREGPTGLLTTTTAVSLHPENETRMLSIPVDDTNDQTRAVISALMDETPRDVDRSEWQALQVWISLGPNVVTIPFRAELGSLIPPTAVRLRRDIVALLSLIHAHAILHQAGRERDDKGKIIATFDDYEVVRDLTHDLVADGIGATVPKTIRETVEAVEAVRKGGGGHVTNTAVAKRLGLDKSVASRRVKVAIKHGYLHNLETTPGRPTKLITGDPIPGDQEVLPTVEALRGCMTVAGAARPQNPCQATVRGDGCSVAQHSERIHTPPRAIEPSEKPAPVASEAPPSGGNHTGGHEHAVGLDELDIPDFLKRPRGVDRGQPL